MNRQKAKGDRAELEAAALIADLTGLPVRRKLGAGRLDDTAYANGYAAALHDAVEAVRALPCMTGRGQDRKARHVDDFKDDAVAAIEALANSQTAGAETDKSPSYDGQWERDLYGGES